MSFIGPDNRLYRTRAEYDEYQRWKASIRESDARKKEREYYQELRRVLINRVQTYEAEVLNKHSTAGRMLYLPQLQAFKKALAGVERGLGTGRFIFTPEEKNGLALADDHVTNQANASEIKRRQERQATLKQIPREAAAAYLKLHPIKRTEEQWDRTSYLERQKYEENVLAQLELEARLGTGRFSVDRDENIHKTYESIFPTG
jgi:hypothetical protein